MTYNHEKFVADALEGFLMQITDFPFEVLIHDDASTDKTAEIIREYVKSYPSIIHPIYETENQYSKKDGSLARIVKMMSDNSKSQYMALCEGDDYWTDPYKLQKQVDYLQKHPDCSICITNGMAYNCKTDSFSELFVGKEAETSKISQIITLDNAYILSFPPTASYVYVRSKFNFDSNVPRCPSGDLRTRLMLMTEGYCFYLSDKTCVYRTNVENSAMFRWRRLSRAQQYQNSERIINMIDSIDLLTEHKHSAGLWEIKQGHITKKLNSAKGFSEFKNKESCSVFKKKKIKYKIRIIARMIMPDFLWEKINRKDV